MADYPSVIQVIGTNKKSSYGTVVDRAVSGKPRLRTYYTQQWDVFEVVHDCESTDMGSLLSHYSSDRLNSFEFTYAADNQAYTVMYAQAPQVVPLEGDFRYRVTNTLVTI
jgi:hypothetical protein